MHNCLVLFQIRCLYNYDIENVVSYALETHKYVSNDLKKKKTVWNLPAKNLIKNINITLSIPTLDCYCTKKMQIYILPF